MQDAGALALARSMPYCHWLVSLDLRGNSIGEQVGIEEVFGLNSGEGGFAGFEFHWTCEAITLGSRWALRRCFD